MLCSNSSPAGTYPTAWDRWGLFENLLIKRCTAEGFHNHRFHLTEGIIEIFFWNVLLLGFFFFSLKWDMANERISFLWDGAFNLWYFCQIFKLQNVKNFNDFFKLSSYWLQTFHFCTINILSFCFRHFSIFNFLIYMTNFSNGHHKNLI